MVGGGTRTDNEHRKAIAMKLQSTVTSGKPCNYQAHPTHTDLSRRVSPLVALLFVMLGAATLASEPNPPDVVIGPYVAASFPGAFPLHGCGGDHVLVFGVQPAESPESERGVHVALRTTGTPIGRVAPPPVGWKVPLSLELHDFTQ